MKKIFTLSLALLLGGIAAQAQEAGYQPLVREGVVWHYADVNEIWPNEDNCTMFFDGDSIINNVVYKKCIEVSANGRRRVAALMREQDRIVYSIGGSTMAEEREGVYEGEIILYDFQNPANMFPDDAGGLNLTQSTVMIDGVPCQSYTSYNNTIVEGIGLDGSGTLADLFFAIRSSDFNKYTGLSYVEKDGKVIYRGSAYENGYLPLVRVGVRWKCAETRYRYDEPIVSTSYYWYEFKGDTTINGRNYLKLYRTTEDRYTEIPCDSQYPLAYMRNDGHWVMVSEAKAYGVNPETLDNVFDVLRQEGDEYALYYFDNPSEAYNVDYTFMPADSVQVGDSPFAQVAWTLGGDDILCAGIGWDLREGDPFVLMAPKATSPQHNEYGFVGLYDLDGNVLYKGACYDDSHDGLAKVEVCGERLRVRQSATTVLVDVPADGLLSVFDMAGHVVTSGLVAQGTAEIPAGQLAAGVYVVQLSTATGTQTAKVVVQ